MNIYILRGREQTGPFSPQEINDQLSRGELTSSALAWFEGCSEWVPIGSVPGITSLEEPSSGASSASQEKADVRGSSSQHGASQASTSTVDQQQRFYGQAVQAFQLATIHLIEPFDQLDEVVRSKGGLDPLVFFRLFLTHAAKFNDDCSTAFAIMLRQSTRLDAVRGATAKQLAREIRAEAFEECDAALDKYHQTLNYLMGGAKAAIEQADSMGTPVGPTGGALIGSLVAGRGSRAAGAVVGGLTALAGAMSTFNRQLALHGQALELTEQAEKAAPAQVSEYLDAVAKMPIALVDLLGSKCFGGAVDMQAQQQCVQTRVEHVKRLNVEAAESVRAMYQHVEWLAEAAQAEENRQIRLQ